MAKIQTTSMIEELSGKLSGRETIYYRTNRRTGKQHVVAYSRERMQSRPTTDRQREVREAYRNRQRVATEWYHSIKPTATNVGDPVQWRLLMKAYQAQIKIGNPYTFAIKYYANMTKGNSISTNFKK